MRRFALALATMGTLAIGFAGVAAQAHDADDGWRTVQPRYEHAAPPPHGLAERLPVGPNPVQRQWTRRRPRRRVRAGAPGWGREGGGGPAGGRPGGGDSGSGGAGGRPASARAGGGAGDRCRALPGEG